MTTNVKQVIVVRRDLNMRKGKIAAQAAHASMKVILDLMDKGFDTKDTEGWMLRFQKGSNLDEWLNGSFTKICVSVTDEQQLLAILNDARKAGFPCALITDNGLTEFHGVKTNTCVAIGPYEGSKIDGITGHLPLL